ncbi:major facilitator superfamily permease [Pelomyxa schiedti]|nr:major facilitator superfamily permease [Pelomyxa schiedti]
MSGAGPSLGSDEGANVPPPSQPPPGYDGRDDDVAVPVAHHHHHHDHEHYGAESPQTPDGGRPDEGMVRADEEKRGSYGTGGGASGAPVKQPLNSEKVPLVEKPRAMRHFKRSVFGWLCFGLVWNILNTAVFATLYPKILQTIDENYVSDFSTANMITTLLSSFLLPPLGSLADQMKQVRRWMFATELVGIALCYVFLPMTYLNSPTAQIVLAQILYTLTLFFLRVAVMDNNALLNCFPDAHRTTLSLLTNFIGFGAAFLSLFILFLLTKGDDPPLSNVALVFIFALVVTVIALFTYLAPSDAVPLREKQSFGKVVIKSFQRMGTTFLALKNKPEYRKIAYFLLAYLFYSTSGTVFTIYVITFFIDLYGVDTNQSVEINMCYLLASFFGTLIGMLYKKFIGDHEIWTLLIQNCLFLVLFIILFLSYIWDWGIYASLGISLGISLNYAWNAGLSRGYLFKITPGDKRGEFSGFYSTFTYLGISIVSGVFVIMTNCDVGTQWLLPLLASFSLPSYIFFFLLIWTQRQESKNTVN